MNDEIYELDEDGSVYQADELIEPIDVVSKLNNLTYRNKKLEKQLRVKKELCEAYEKKYYESNELCNEYNETINGLRKELEEHERVEKELDINYWKGIEETYEKLIKRYLDIITSKEIEIFGLEIERDWLMEKLGDDDG